MSSPWKLLGWIFGGTAVLWGGATLMNRASAKGRTKLPPMPVAGATVRWTRGLYTAAVHRSAAPAGAEPGYTWAVWLSSDVLAAGNSLDDATNAGKKLIDGPADDYKAAVGAANQWIDGMKGKPPKGYPKPPTPTPDEPKQPEPGQIGWYTRGVFAVITWREAGPEGAGVVPELWRWKVYRGLEVVLYGQDWTKILALEPDIAVMHGEADSWYNARVGANAWVDMQMQGEAVMSPANPDEVIAYPPSFFAEVANLPVSLMPPVDGLVELSSKVPGADDCGAILVGPQFWERAGNVANWLWDGGQRDLRTIQNAILDEFTSKCRTANTPAAQAFRIELGKHLAELKAYKENE